MSLARLSICILFLANLLGCAFQGEKKDRPLSEMSIARRFIEMQQFSQAKEIARPVAMKSNQDVEAWACYQDSIFLDTRISPDEKKEYKRLAKECPSDLQEYLEARLLPDVEKKIAVLETLFPKAEKSPPLRYWINLSIAESALPLGFYEKCEKNILSALKIDPERGEAHLLYAFLFLKKANWKDALFHAKKAQEKSPYLIKPYFFDAADNMISGNYVTALHVMKKVRLLFPFYTFNEDESVAFLSSFWREMIDLKEQGLSESGLKVAEEALGFFPGHFLFLTFKAVFLSRLGRDREAEETIVKAIQANPYHLEAVQLYRKMLIRKGRYAQAYRIWQRIVPEEIVFHPENLLRERYVKLERSFQAADPQKENTLSELARAMAHIGWEEEALIVYGQLRSPEFDQERNELRRHVSFLKAIRKLFHAYYDTGTLNILRIFDYMLEMAQKFEIPIETRASKEFKPYFLVVREMDPFDPKPGTIGAYLGRYNKALDLGNNYGYTDARMMNRISLRSHRRNLWGHEISYQAIVGDETQVETFLGYHSGSPKVAGRAFLSSKGFYVALDTLRPGLGRLKNIQARMDSPSPLKEKISGDMPVAFPYLRGISDRLLIRALKPAMDQRKPEEEAWSVLYREVLRHEMEMVHYHELGHVLDFPCFLPIYRRLGNIFEMLWTHRFSPDRIQTRFESVAETFGVTHTPSTHYYLWQLMERLDVSFDGIFEMVYWAWYGRLPQQDPYYLSSGKIFREIMEIEKIKTVDGLQKFFDSGPRELNATFVEISRRAGIARICK